MASVNKAAVESKPHEIASALSATGKHPAPRAGGCRIEGFVKVKKVCSCQT